MPNPISKKVFSVLFAATISLPVSLVLPAFAGEEDFDNIVDSIGLDEDFAQDPTPIDELGGQQAPPGTEPIYDEGVTITQVEIKGNDNVADTTILGAIETRPGTVYSKKRLKQDLESIYELGYFTEKLKAVPVAARDGIHVRFEVEENPIVSNFEIEGVQSIPMEDLKEPFGDMTGQPQNIKAINNGIKEIEKIYRDKGYVLARVEGIDEKEDGTVILKVNEGIINKIKIEGNKKTKDYVLTRAMAQKEGKPYNEKVVSEDLKRIFSTQTVSDVRRVIKASAEKEGTYDLTVETDEKKTGTISFGGGADTAAGVFASTGYSDPNFMGRGYNLNIMGGLGSGVIGANRNVVRRRTLQAQANFFNPSLFGTKNSMGLGGFAREYGSLNVPLGIERRIGGQVSLARPVQVLDLPGSSAVAVDLGFENVDPREASDLATLAGFYSITPQMREEQLEGGSYLSLSPSFTNDTRDNRFNPNRGHFYTFTNRNSLGFGVDSYSNLTTNLRRYLRVTDDITFAVQGMSGLTAFGDVPQFNQFRMGGANSIRGFQEGALGTGQHFLQTSAELRTKVPFLRKFKKYPIYDMTQLVLFTDAGQLFDRNAINDNFGRPGYGVSVGAGLRLNLPFLGPVRVDFGIPVVGNGNINNFNFGVGQRF